MARINPYGILRLAYQTCDIRKFKSFVFKTKKLMLFVSQTSFIFFFFFSLFLTIDFHINNNQNFNLTLSHNISFVDVLQAYASMFHTVITSDPETLLAAGGFVDIFLLPGCCLTIWFQHA